MIWALLACAPPVAEGSALRPDLVPPMAVVPEWPAAGTPLRVLDVPAPRNLHRKTVFLMAGHANGAKDGNTGVHGQIEAEVVHDAVLDLAERLAALDRFDLVIGRRGNERPSYPSRIAHAEAVGADAFIELHTDSRGPAHPWAALPDGDVAYESVDEHGFAVLYNESTEIGPTRRALAVTAAESLAAAGFPAYSGRDYGSLYDLEGTPGVFIDRRGLMMLRRPTVPSIIIETHNAKDFEESLRWREEGTSEAFAAAVADALTRYLSDP
ncbi:MAG: N-acetylmuramoyl-L-alanine amidase [Myxococcota bacterium]